MGQTPEDTAISVQEPGEEFHGTLTVALRESFGITDEALEAVAVRAQEKYKRIDRAERDAMINSRNIVIGRTTLS